MDPRAAAAREENRLSRESEINARVHRERRDVFVRQLKEEGWSYGRIAGAVGCSKELVAYIVKTSTAP